MEKKVIIIIVIILIISSIIGIGIIKGINEEKEEESKKEYAFNQEDEKTKDINAEINKLLEKSDISNYLPRDISEIKLINYQTEDQKTDIYTDSDLILELVRILHNATWTETDENIECCYFGIDIKGKDSTTRLELEAIHVTEMQEKLGYIKLIKGDLKVNFTVNGGSYYELYGFEKPKYYLHKSNLELPNKDICYKAKEKALTGLNENEIKELQKTIYDYQCMMESILGECTWVLKEKTSYYWRQQIYDEVFTDNITGTKVYNGARLIKVLQEVKKQVEIIKDEETKRDLEKFCNLLKEGLDEHDIEKCFEAHEILHDYSIWVINYPVMNLMVEPYDWSAFKTYFGKASIIK